jgi:hypothetical protein
MNFGALQSKCLKKFLGHFKQNAPKFFWGTSIIVPQKAFEAI